MQVQKIDTVVFYTSILELDSFNCHDILKGNNIPIYITHGIPTKEYSNTILTHLSNDVGFTEKQTKVAFDKFPIITWRTFSDDGAVYLNYAIGSDQLANSELIINKSLIDANTSV